MEKQSLYEYPQLFFNYIRDWSINSAQVIVPLVVSELQPQTVVDVGCGDGSWLSVFADLGIQKIMGLDGSYMLDRDLKIPREKHFVRRDYAFRVYRVANENRDNPACWLALISSFFMNPALLGRVGKAMGRRWAGKKDPADA